MFITMMRKHTKGILIKIIVGLIAVVFVLCRHVFYTPHLVVKR